MDFPHFSRVNFKKIQGLIQDPDDFHCHFCFLDCMGTIAMRIYLFSNQWTLPPPSNPAQPPLSYSKPSLLFSSSQTTALRYTVKKYLPDKTRNPISATWRMIFTSIILKEYFKASQRRCPRVLLQAVFHHPLSIIRPQSPTTLTHYPAAQRNLAGCHSNQYETDVLVP